MAAWASPNSGGVDSFSLKLRQREMDDFDEEGDDLLSSFMMDQYKGTDVVSPGMSDCKDSCKDCPADFDSDGEDDILMAAADVDTEILQRNTRPPGFPPPVKAEDTVTIPMEFPFPFEPYDIQKGFMKELYRTLELGKVGIFESPTGTGKSLSVICGALRWLKDFQERQKAELDKLLEEEKSSKREEDKENNAAKNKHAELDWISEFKEKKETEEKYSKKKEELELRFKRESKLTEMKKSKAAFKRKRQQQEEEFDGLMRDASADVKDAYKSELERHAADDASLDTEDENLILAEYDSDGGKDANDSDDDNDKGAEALHCTKIYFCSRTHSQLSQFVREVIKSPYGDDTRVISLGSRQNLCVNEAVKKLKSLSLINDACRDLLNKTSGKSVKSESKRKRTVVSKGCPYYRQDPIQDFRDTALIEVRDIEQLVSVGRQKKACPYYGTRLAIPDAEIVALPYNTLLHKSTREASGIRLKDNIVIVDEAHNLLETINSVYSTEITGAQLVRAHCQLSQYEKKYQSRLKAKNLMYIQQMLFILSKLAKCIGGRTDQAADKQTCTVIETKLWKINDFLFYCQLDNMNMFKVLRYCQQSQIARKLQGFVEKYHSEIVIKAQEKKEETSTSGLSSFLKTISGKGDDSETSAPEATCVPDDRRDAAVMSSPLMHIEGFLLALTNADKDGRIVINRQGLFSQCSIKFLLLNPAIHFAEIVQEARAVVVAGGTMQPICEFKDQLFHAAGVSPDRILEYSCGHVIPADQLLPIAMTTGPTGIQLDFTYQNRGSHSLLDELGRLVCNVCNIVPGGVICFFPSYDYEKTVYTHWEKNGTIAKLECKKRVFREPKRASQVDRVLGDYSSCIQNCCGTVTGAMLLCVVGGKMSEGINFSDNLGRCVLMVGMPYPNINSPELKEKMNYLNANFPRDSEGKQPGQVHYENLCMKAVNQSIGRAIRHQGDYATILLLDRRYGRTSTVNKLPGWISKHLHKMDKFGTVFAAISKFFANKKTS